MKIDRVLLTKDEAAWLSRNVSKTKTILEAAAKKDPQILERKTYKTLSAVEKAVTEMPKDQETVELVVPPKQKQALAALVLQTMMILNEQVIPEYTRRNLTEYLSDATMKAGLLKNMYRKLR